MNVVYNENALPQVSAFNWVVNFTEGSDRVKAPVVGAGSMDFGGSHKYYAANETNAIVEENKNSSDARMESEDVATTPRNGVLITWKNIQGAESEEDELLGKVQAYLDSIESVVSEARNLQNKQPQHFFFDWCQTYDQFRK